MVVEVGQVSVEQAELLTVATAVGLLVGIQSGGVPGPKPRRRCVCLLMSRRQGAR